MCARACMHIYIYALSKLIFVHLAVKELKKESTVVSETIYVYACIRVETSGWKT